MTTKQCVHMAEDPKQLYMERGDARLCLACIKNLYLATNDESLAAGYLMEAHSRARLRERLSA